MFTFETKIRVRYAETDQMGYVYYGNYATFFEVARVEMLRSIGQAYNDLEKQGVMMPVTELFTKYIRPAHYDDLLTVKVVIKELPSVKIRFDYEIYNESEELINFGHTQLVFVDMERNRPCMAPEGFLSKIKTYF